MGFAPSSCCLAASASFWRIPLGPFAERRLFLPRRVWLCHRLAQQIVQGCLAAVYPPDHFAGLPAARLCPAAPDSEGLFARHRHHFVCSDPPGFARLTDHFSRRPLLGIAIVRIAALLLVLIAVLFLIGVFLAVVLFRLFGLKGFELHSDVFVVLGGSVVRLQPEGLVEGFNRAVVITFFSSAVPWL